MIQGSAHLHQVEDLERIEVDVAEHEPPQRGIGLFVVGQQLPDRAPPRLRHCGDERVSAGECLKESAAGPDLNHGGAVTADEPPPLLHDLIKALSTLSVGVGKAFESFGPLMLRTVRY